MICKKLVLVLALMFLIPTVLAGNGTVTVEEISKGDVIVSELGNPALFDLIINNSGPEEDTEIYSFVGVSFLPEGKFFLKKGETKIERQAFVGGKTLESEGIYLLEYWVIGADTGTHKDRLKIEVAKLENVIKVNVEGFVPNDDKTKVTIKNSKNAYLPGLKIKGKSRFFEFEKDVELEPFEEINFEIEINKGLRTVKAGQYIGEIDVLYGERMGEIETIVNYLEKEGVAVKEDSSGILRIRKTTSKENLGNVAIPVKIEIRKDIISRLFTTYSETPSFTDRGGLGVTYNWEKVIEPGETYSIETTTNYTIPFIALILFVVALFLFKTYSLTALSVKKNVNFVKTKTGDFALKVTLRVKARKHIDNIQLVDKLPSNTKLYQKYGRLPDKMDEATRRLMWNINTLNKGEERVFSYIVYSKLRVFGRFELPQATAIFESEGKNTEVWSNKAFFAAESARGEEI